MDLIYYIKYLFYCFFTSGMYGIPRKWYFPFQKSYWFSQQVNQELIQQNVNINNEIIELANEGEHIIFFYNLSVMNSYF